MAEWQPIDREQAARIAENMRPSGGRMWTNEQSACFEALTNCAALIRALPSGWREISTAPKDGSEILLAHGNSVWIDEWIEFEDGAACWMMCDQWTTPETPTHWMPLPDPPTTE